ncbi:2-phosphosulfolactate phosphatase [Fictibacillus terranigra]|uniref:Probable 2-phosphosulfolactate phosphatase n=1 Tax=Fictibacillus terranigra TaxID=3058424 RepID=A0ABT8E2V7_9BACL|nr:2-phosphosulfolactate phosphatase [Fictibacillus sp. CENA-BCM004]MDN4072221.1 2-phosphosulfolactate phosphatase [Fictibacillus sp. CENA-BCM004]
MSVFHQQNYQCKTEWGVRGAREAAERGDIIVVVDILSFSSTVVTALSYGAKIFPYPPPINEEAKKYAEEVGAELLSGRAEALKWGTHSLSPASFSLHDQEKKFVMCSLNGAACIWAARKVPALLIGCLRNASAAAEKAEQLQKQSGAEITVVACGERWENPKEAENNIRPGIEDYLGAGAILSKLNGSKSPEAQVCIGAYLYQKENIKEIIWNCGSGLELRERGFSEDVEHCTKLDELDLVPQLKGNVFTKS